MTALDSTSDPVGRRPERPTVDGGMTLLAASEHHHMHHSLQFTEDGRFLLAGCSDGAVRVIAGASCTTLQPPPVVALTPVAPPCGPGFDELALTRAGHGGDVPVTCIATGGVASRAVAFSVGCGGTVAVHRVVEDASGVDLEVLTTGVEAGNETQCCDYRHEEGLGVTGGSDHVVRIYDVNAAGKTFDAPVATLTKARDHTHGGFCDGHVNRIFTVRFVTSQVVISGGWESPIRVWDLRTGHTERILEPAAGTTEPLRLGGGTTHGLYVRHARDSIHTGVGASVVAGSTARRLHVFNARTTEEETFGEGAALTAALGATPPKVQGVAVSRRCLPAADGTPGAAEVLWVAGSEPGGLTALRPSYAAGDDAHHKPPTKVAASRVVCAAGQAPVALAVSPVNPYIAVAAMNCGTLVAALCPSA